MSEKSRSALLVLTIVLALAVPGAFVAGFAARGGRPSSSGKGGAKQVWTCSMHPQIRQPESGLCPICNMELVPAGGSDSTAGPRQLVLSDSARALAEVRTARVERRFVEAKVRMVGKVDYDETRVKSISARFPGRLDRLYVDYTGVPVRKGEHLFHIYSPELLAAQEELLGARKTLAGAAGEFLKRSARDTLKAAREKLLLWGLNREQVAAIEKSGKASDRLTIYSPMSGIVTRKHLDEGAYVKTGGRVYTLADLSRVWIRLHAYESDLVWLRYGQKVEFVADAQPGRAFRGKITFIDPVLDAATRTVKLRVIAENPREVLKPGMFVRAVVRARVAGSGKVMDPALAGKWISPMHPEVVSDKPGKCTVCGMDLVKAETLGYSAAKRGRAPLVIPASAPLLTGKRAVVYVRVPGAKQPTFEGRDVVLGPRAGDYYIVKSGLKPGEEVVVRGAFKIDSALQIEGKHSMMSPAPRGGAPGESRPQTHCPVMGGKINRKVFADHGGKRVYFCCPGCDATFKRDPEKYLRKMREAGVKLEDALAPPKSGGPHGH